jgi:hypothetical protein
VKDFSVAHGYAVVIQKSNIPRGQVWLRCDLGGTYRNTLNLSQDQRKRKCSSRLLNCPFLLYGRRLQDSSWHLRVQNAEHNHEMATGAIEMVTHPIARRLTSEQKKLVEELTEMGARPAFIVETLKQKFPDKPIKVQDIYNTRNFIRREKNAGRTPFLDDTTATEVHERETFDPSGINIIVPKNQITSSLAINKTPRERFDVLVKDMEANFIQWNSQEQSHFVTQLQRLVNKFKKQTISSNPSTQQSAPGLLGSLDNELAMTDHLPVPPSPPPPPPPPTTPPPEPSSPSKPPPPPTGPPLMSLSLGVLPGESGMEDVLEAAVVAAAAAAAAEVL